MRWARPNFVPLFIPAQHARARRTGELFTAAFLALSVALVVTLFLYFSLVSEVRQVDVWSPSLDTFHNLEESGNNPLCECTTPSIEYGSFSKVNVQVWEACTALPNLVFNSSVLTLLSLVGIRERDMRDWIMVLESMCGLIESVTVTVVERLAKQRLVSSFALTETLLSQQLDAHYEAGLAQVADTMRGTVAVTEMVMVMNRPLTLGTNFGGNVFRGHPVNLSTTSLLASPIFPFPWNGSTFAPVFGHPYRNCSLSFSSSFPPACTSFQGMLQSELTEMETLFKLLAIPHPSRWVTMRDIFYDAGVVDTTVTHNYQTYYDTCKPPVCRYTVEKAKPFLETLGLVFALLGAFRTGAMVLFRLGVHLVGWTPKPPPSMEAMELLEQRLRALETAREGKVEPQSPVNLVIDDPASPDTTTSVQLLSTEPL